ncbi:type IV toxin-antitoxin system AbiEi family antitoxin domain-containing protein [Microvirga sp. 0TCS3.31]
MTDVDALLIAQDGVVSRAQALQAGLRPQDVRRLVRRRELATLHPGVYLAHTGPPTWLQRAWGAVLACGSPHGFAGAGLGAALAGASAMRAADGPGRAGGDDGPIEVVVPRSRRVVAPPGVRVTRTFLLDERVLWNLGPPRMRYEEAALDVALGTTDDFAAIGVIARAVQDRHTTAVRMQQALDSRARAPRRYFLEAVLGDVARGTCSVLEHAFLTLVEQPHGLPRADRQLREGTRTGIVYRDVSYGERLIELDGRLRHDTAEQRDRDFERDLDAAVEGRSTVRLTWGQVLGRPCSTAAKLSALLELDGWPPGWPCGPGCALARAA